MLRASFLAAAIFSIAGPASSDEGTVIGEWSGRYTCAQGITGVRVVVAEATPVSASALFHFFAVPENPRVPEGCFTLEGTYDSAAGRLELRGGDWLLRPSGYVTVDFLGQLDPAGRRFSGQVVGPSCTTFDLVRGAPVDRPIPGSCEIDVRIAEKTADVITEALLDTRAVALPLAFEAGSDQLTVEARRQLDEVGRVLASGEFTDGRVGVFGHTENTGNFKADVALSEQQARAAAAYLQATFGFAPDRLVVRGMGHTEPLNPSLPAAPENRRIELRLL